MMRLCRKRAEAEVADGPVLLPLQRQVGARDARILTEKQLVQAVGGGCHPQANFVLQERQPKESDRSVV